MVLCKGDFIEDKLGQFQRDSLVSLQKESRENTQTVFRWFGSYLVWPSTAAMEDDRIMVSRR